MATLFESPVNPMVAVLYKECKEECKFSEKSDSDFLLFLLNSAVRILNVVKDFSPLLTPESTPIPDRVPNEERNNENMENEESDKLDMILDKLEESSDLETLQQYIDNVQNSLQSLEDAAPDQSDIPDINLDCVGEVLKSSNSDENEENKPSESIFSDAITEILSKANFDENIRDLASLNSSLTAESGAYFTCTICSTQFKNHRNLSRHIRLGICLQKSFSCSLCDHTFATEYALKRHLNRTMCKKRAMLEDVIASPNKMQKTDVNQFVCDKCSFSFATRAALTQHASSTKCDNNRLQGLNQKEPRPQGFFECPHCRSTLASKAGLAKHLKRAQCRVYQCPDCPRSFRYLHEVRAHRRIEHQCSDDMNLSQSYSIGDIPTMTLPSSLFTSLPILKTTQIEAHQCKVCSYTGTCKRSLENHMRMHVRQLKAIGSQTDCTQCEFSSEDPNALLKHYITLHPGLPYFKMAPKGTVIIRSNRISSKNSNDIPLTDIPSNSEEEKGEEEEEVEEVLEEEGKGVEKEEEEEVDCVSVQHGVSVREITHH